MLNSYAGLTVPLIASATATFLFRQFFLTVPDELIEAARMDGAGPMRFFWDVLLPLSKTTIAALFVIQFIYGWNQYLWPLLVTTSEDMYPVVIGIKRMIAGGDGQNEWNIVMATAHAGHAAARAGGDPDAEMVRQGPGGHRKVTQHTSPVHHLPTTDTDMAALSLRNVIKRYGHGPKANQVIHGVERRDPRPRVHRHRRPLGLRQVHPAAHGRRAGGNQRPARSRIGDQRGQRPRALRARHRDGVPELRALPAHDACSTTWPTA